MVFFHELGSMTYHLDPQILPADIGDARPSQCEGQRVVSAPAASPAVEDLLLRAEASIQCFERRPDVGATRLQTRCLASCLA